MGEGMNDYLIEKLDQNDKTEILHVNR